MAKRIANSLDFFRESPLSTTLHAEDQKNISDILEDYFYDSCDETQDSDSSENEDCYDKQGNDIIKTVITDTNIKYSCFCTQR